MPVGVEFCRSVADEDAGARKVRQKVRRDSCSASWASAKQAVDGICMTFV